MHAWQFARALGTAEKNGWTRFVSICPNLRENIRPTRERDRLVVPKNPSHAVNQIWLRRS
jgi:hypothetical protein